ncbi:hypothetical protein G3M58_94115, partial [Streptomyces sp. SID7499]|nr:hypothetical protein [Streptomyces sp. SID7499]
VLRTLARDERGVLTLAAAARRLGWAEERARAALDALVEAGLIGLVSEPDEAFAYPPGGQSADRPAPESYRCSPLVRLLFRRPAAGA